MTCLMPSCKQNWENSVDVNCGPLSETMVLGRPSRANILFRACVEESDEDDEIWVTKGKLE